MTVVPASYGARVGAYLIDGILPFVLFLPSLIAFISASGMGATGDFEGAATASAAASNLEVVAVFVNLAYGIGLWIAEAKTGMTIGKRALGLRTVRADTLQLAGFGRIIGRYLIIALGGLVIIGQYIVLLSPLWDSEHRNRGWHDKAANTWVLDVKHGPNPLLPSSPIAVPVPVSEATAGIVSVGIPSTGSDPVTSPPTQPEPAPLNAFEEPRVAAIEHAPHPVAAISTMPATSPATEPSSSVIVGVPGFAPAPSLQPAPAPDLVTSSSTPAAIPPGSSMRMTTIERARRTAPSWPLAERSFDWTAETNSRSPEQPWLAATQPATPARSRSDSSAFPTPPGRCQRRTPRSESTDTGSGPLTATPPTAPGYADWMAQNRP